MPDRSPVSAAAIFALLIFGLLLPGRADASFDSLELQLRQQYPPALRWDNIEGSPFLVDGPAPAYEHAAGMHLFSLAPGQDIKVRIPPNSRLRVHSESFAGVSAPLRFMLSRGLGLLAEVVPVPGADGRNLLISPPDGVSHFCTVMNPESASGTVSFGLFLSRFETVADVSPYREALGLPGADAVVSQKGSAGYEAFSVLAAGERKPFYVQGPARIRIESRVLYTDDAHQRRREYSIHAELDEVPFANFEYSVTPNEAQMVTVDGDYLPIGGSEVGFIDITQGVHSFSLSSTAPAVVRVSRLQSPDYMVPSLNRPTPSPEEIMKKGFPKEQRLALWQVREREIDAVRKAPGSDVERTERVAWRLTRDNNISDGALLGRDLMRRAANAHPAYSDIRRAGTGISGSGTGFRNLLPSSPQQMQQKVFWTAPLRYKERSYRGMALSEQLLGDTLELVGDAFFTRFEEGASLEYRLPERPAPTLMRLLALHPSQQVALTLQMDNGHRTSMVLLPSVELPKTDFRPSVGTAALAVSSFRYSVDSSPLGCPFGAEQYPAPLVSPAVLELELAPDVKKVTVALDSGTVKSVDIAVQILMANQSSLPQKAYLERIEAFGGEAEALKAFLQAVISPDVKKTETGDHCLSSGEVAALDLKNDWIPLIRHLRALDARFRAGVTDASAASQNGLRPRLHATLAAARRSAGENMRQGNTVLAVEDWAEVVRLSPAGEQAGAQIELAKALLAAGEDVLAVSQLKGLFLFSSDAGIREQAYAQLRMMYEKREDAASVLPLEAARFLLAPDAVHAASLAACLAKNEYRTEAVKIGLLVADSLDDTSSAQLYAAALNLQWIQAGQVFSSGKDEPYNRAMELLALNAPRQAWPFFKDAGSAGLPYVQAIESGLDILKRLQEDDLQIRMQAVLDWEQWQWNHPGGRREASLAQSVTGHGGTMQMKSRTRGLRSISYVAAPGRPVKARFYGPLSVKVVSRPLHVAFAAKEIEGWLEVREKEQFHFAPINNNWPSAGLLVEGNENVLPGRAVELVRTFGPGLHEIEVSGQDLTLAVQLFACRPDLSVSILPLMTPENVGAVLAGRTLSPFTDAAKGAAWRLGEELVVYAAANNETRCMSSQSVVDGLLSLPLPVRTDRELWQKLESYRREHPRKAVQEEDLYVARVSSFKDSASAISEADVLNRTGIPMSVVRLYDDSGEEWFVVQSLPYKSTGEARKCIARFKDKGIQSKLGKTSSGILRQRIVAGYMPPRECPLNEGDEAMAVALGQGRLDEALALSSEATPQDVLTKMSILVRLGETTPERLVEVEARAQELYERHSCVAGLKALLGRLSGLTAWQSVASIRSSAGIRYVPTSSWQNESPYVRARQAVFGPVHEDEVLLQGVNPFVYNVQSPRTEDIVLHFELPRVPHLAPIPATVAWQVDDGTVERAELTPETPAGNTRIKVARGHHSLRVWIENPRRNQFLRVRLQDPGGAGHVDASGAYFERRYYLATPEVPVVAAIKGPAWVRVDELKGKRAVFSYRSIGEGWHEIRLQPTQGSEALYRISSRSISLVGRVAGMPPESPDYTEMSGPPFSLAASPVPSAARFHDDFALGGQQDGTWELETSAVKRRDVGEDTGSKDAEQFLQLAVRHRYYSDDMPAYFKTEVLARKHEFGGPTIGILEDFTYLPRSVPLTFNLAGNVYIQAPKSGEVYWGKGRTEWSAYLRGRVSQKRDFNEKSYHVPAASIFVRALSMNEDSRYKGKELDRDVFTDYKADHKIGWRIGDTFYHRPFLDTLLFGGASLTTNEQMNPFKPDYVSFRTGWSQLFGAVQTELGYRFTHYYSDADRSGSNNRDFLSLGAHWDYWLENQDRVRLGFKTEYDLEAGEPSGSLNFSWFWSEGRGLKDFRPRAEERFHDLKERAVPSNRNNAVDYVMEQ